MVRVRCVRLAWCIVSACVVWGCGPEASTSPEVSTEESSTRPLEALVDATLLPFPANSTGSAHFGYDVAVDGDVMVVGSGFYTDGDPSYEGAAFLYERDGNGAWTYIKQLSSPNPEEGGYFGRAVAVADGVVVVGAANESPGVDDSGAAYVFEEMGGDWVVTASLSGRPGLGGEFFGTSVATDGARVVVGAIGEYVQGSYGGAYVFERSGATWAETARLEASSRDGFDDFGMSVAVEGARIAVGDTQARAAGNVSGGVYLFEYVNSTWSQVERITPPSPSNNMRVGQSVALDGERLVVGAPGVGLAGYSDSGEAYLYEYDAADDRWRSAGRMSSETEEPEYGFGHDVALRGDTIAVAAYDFDGLNQGTHPSFKVELFQTTADGLSRTQIIESPNGGDEDGFGNSVAMSEDTLVIGARRFDPQGKIPNSGGVYVHEVLDARADSAETVEDMGVAIDLLANDVVPEGARVEVPQLSEGGGTIQQQGSVYLYTPAENFIGTDSFTYSVTSGTQRVEAQVFVTVTPADDPPTLPPVTIETLEDTPGEVTIEIKDVDTPEEDRSASVTSEPANGTLALEGSTLTYTPDDDFFGDDAAELTITDGTSSVVVPVSITVTGVNDAPVVRDVVGAVERGGSVSITLEGQDVDGDELEYVVQPPGFGTIKVEGETLTYLPGEISAERVSMTYTAWDGEVNSTEADIVITILAGDDDPGVTLPVEPERPDILSCATSPGAPSGRAALALAALLGALAWRRRRPRV